MASLSTCHLGLWLGWQILLNLVKCSATVKKASIVVNFDVDISRLFTRSRVAGTILNSHHYIRSLVYPILARLSEFAEKR